MGELGLELRLSCNYRVPLFPGHCTLDEAALSISPPPLSYPRIWSDLQLIAACFPLAFFLFFLFLCFPFSSHSSFVSAWSFFLFSPFFFSFCLPRNVLQLVSKRFRV